MNSKKIAKIGSALLIIGAIMMAVNMVFASTAPIPSANFGAANKMSSPVTMIIGIVSYVCYAAAVIMLVLLGIRYVSAAPEGKAEIKKTAVQYVIGAALVFAAGAILGIIQSVSTTVAGSGGSGGSGVPSV